MSQFLKVWSKFSTVAKNGGQVLNFRIVDMPEILRQDLVDLYINYFIKEEATFKAAGVSKSIKALNEIREPILKESKRPGFHTVICSIDDNDDQIKHVVGASMMQLAFKDDPVPEYNFETQEVKKIFEISHGLTACFDEVKAFSFDRYFSARGVFVCPEFRGLGIAQKLLSVRRQICKEHNIPIHGAWVTSYGTLKASERDGWEAACEISSEEFGKRHGVTFEDVPPTFKYKFETQEIKKIFEISYGLIACFDEVKTFNFDRYFSDRGIFVCSKFRGLGVAQQLLNVRRQICKEHNIPIHGAWVTSYGTLKASERDGWEAACEISSEEFGKRHGVTFEDVPPTFKFMIARIH